MKDILERLRNPRWPVLIYVLIALVGVIVLWWRLATIVPNVQGWSLLELQARANSNSIHKIIGNPLYLPHKLLQYGFMLVGREGLFWMRLVSTLFAGVIVVAYYQILRRWYSSRVALLCSFLFLTSAWFLHYARLGTPSILFASSIGLLWVGIRLRTNASRSMTLTIGGVLAISMLYIPGYVWIVGALFLWQRKNVMHNFSKLSRKLQALIVGATFFGLAPLLSGLLQHPSLIREWLGLPATFVPATLWSNLWHLPVWLSLQGPRMPVYWLGDVPLLNVFSLTMFILGMFVLTKTFGLDRIKAVLYILAIGCVMAVFNGPVWLFFITPMIFLVVAAGVALLLQQWFTIFPKNPLARSTGIVFVAILVFMAAGYNLNHYFVAWPQSPVTRVVFRFPG